jgi:hypothetical protein
MRKPYQGISKKKCRRPNIIQILETRQTGDARYAEIAKGANQGLQIGKACRGV